MCVFLLIFSFSSNSFNSRFHIFFWYFLSLWILWIIIDETWLVVSSDIFLFSSKLLILEMIINFNFNFTVFLSSLLNDHWWAAPLYSELPSFCNHKWVSMLKVWILFVLHSSVIFSMHFSVSISYLIASCGFSFSCNTLWWAVSI